MEPRGTDGEVLMRRPKTGLIIKSKQERQCTLRRGCAATVAVQKQKELHILRLCLQP